MQGWPLTTRWLLRLSRLSHLLLLLLLCRHHAMPLPPLFCLTQAIFRHGSWGLPPVLRSLQLRLLLVY